MNREIKFRAWNSISKKMFSEQKIGYYGEIKLCDGLEYSYHLISDSFNYKDVIIMQFTGLTDKNGKEIYEGDILNRQYHNCKTYEENGVVEMGYGNDSDGYINGGWYGWKCGESSLSDVNGCAEIIGNKYENPELLEEAK